MLWQCLPRSRSLRGSPESSNKRINMGKKREEAHSLGFEPSYQGLQDFKKNQLHSVSCSVVSNSLRPHAPSPARLLCPWDSPGKNTKVGGHSLLQGKILMRDRSLGFRQVHYQLSHQGSLNVHWKDWGWRWSSNTLAAWCKEWAHWKKKPWFWERLREGGKVGNRG